MQRYLYWLVLLLLLPFVLLVLYVHPSLDDLSVPVLLMRAGEGTRLEIFWRLMHHWNGRYTSNLLAVLSPYTWGSLAGYRLALLLQFPALYFALYYLLSRILSPVLSPALTRRRLHLLSAAILLIYLHWLPDITESIYWLSGAMVYTWALIVQLLVLGLMAASAEKPTTRKTILLAVLLFVLCGFNEIALAVNVAIAVGFVVFSRESNIEKHAMSEVEVSKSQKVESQKEITGIFAPLRRCVVAVKRIFRNNQDNHDNNDNNDNILNHDNAKLTTLLPDNAKLTTTTTAKQTTPPPIYHKSSIINHKFISLLVVLVSAAIILTSKGNTGRMWHFPGVGDVLAALGIAALSTGKLLGVMAQSLPLLLFGFLLLPHASADALRPHLRRMALLHPLLVAALALLTVFAAMAVPAWAMGINPPLRIYNFLGLYLMGFFFWGLFSLHAWLRKKEIALYPAFTGWGRAALVLLIILAMAGDFHKQPRPFGMHTSQSTLYTFRGNLPRVTSDLLLRAKPYSQALQQRQDYVNQQKALGHTHIILEPLQNPPSSILFLDITTDPEHWINKLQAEYYGIEKIEVRDEK